jgi:glutathione-regulated potassium-efflux system ancillary protein KefC/glutathione-regulated potassium-efflux system protein KefB
MSLLAESAIFLAAAVVAVPIFRRLKLGSVLGYLAAGLAIGPWGLQLITDVDNIMHFAELGVVLLLFVIGLELQPSRLWVLRKSVFGLGGAQVAITALLLLGAGLGLGLAWQSALVMGLGLAMSSTAFVLQVLAERGELTTRHGRSAFAILLFQDLSVIPLLALIPLLGAMPGAPPDQHPWLSALIAVGVIAGIVAGGRLLLRPVLQLVAATRLPEIFTAAALLVVIGVSLLTAGIGLSMSLGAFLAGVLLADSEFRHELEANIEPFKGLLLGLFFISVGMAVDVGLLAASPLGVAAAALGLMALKAAVLLALARASGHSWASAHSLAAALSQGGEFAFVLFGVAAGHAVMPQPLVDFLVLAVTVSMALTPLALAAADAVSRRLQPPAAERAYDAIEDNHSQVVIAGFGRVGQIVGRILLGRRIPFTALDINPEQVETVRRFGIKVYFGDASRLDLLSAARTDRARIFVLAIDDVETSLRAAETVRRHFPQVRLFARARNRFHAYRLMDLGAELIERETFLGALALSEQVLRGLRLPPWEAAQSVARFKAHDERTLERQHAVYHDETQLIQTSKQAAAELQGLFESDRESQPASGASAFSPADVR